jgi:hypothetical protein
MLLSSDHPPIDEFEAVTGWRLEPEGACRGSVCVPLPSGSTSEGNVDIEIMAARLGMGIARDEDSGAVALGPASTGGRALATTQAPKLTLPDFNGEPFDLESLLGTKVVLVAWAPY